MSKGMPIPPGPAGLFVIALACAPLVIKKFKPAIKLAGETLVKVGHAIQKTAEVHG